MFVRSSFPPPHALWLTSLAESRARAARDIAAESLAVNADKAQAGGSVWRDGCITDEVAAEGAGVGAETFAGHLAGVWLALACDGLAAHCSASCGGSEVHSPLSMS